MEFKKGDKPETRMLHQLIELAKAGKKFRAARDEHSLPYGPDYFTEVKGWTSEYITAHWQYEEIKAPRFRKEIVDMRNGNVAMGLEWMNGAKWEIVATEVIE